ncbi:putative sugar kinase [Candidatus Planktophila sulfonica]|uniref:ADP-dependent (S)-NAD(P)H-hydrate dehydratase n=1 Tax=Candidatus Planktophila sulfonica TaxID=1884904 RepID=A0A249KFT6_9ACTN|nr:ADP/ATP-dependent (S)-NAD(P)H-hydrate dehydratase [Candidatus Planktophila sulfonica]ASY15654.1 putative sugar kinase [Candidatus Planktophila sulfonica]
MAEKSVRTFTARDAARCIITPSDIDHKYSRGVLGAITGSAQYPGAAVLSTSAALATGIGMVRFHSSSGLAHLVLHDAPETVVQPGPVTAWLAGSGIHHKKYSDFTTWLRHRWFTLMKAQTVPTVLDAGALSYAGKLSQPTLITPHAGELSRLLASHSITVSSEAIEADPQTWAKKTSQLLNVTVLLKGSKTVVAYNDRAIALSKATPWLATAGSGDVLAGIIGALVATNYIEILNSPERLADVAATGAYIHNQAALLASQGAPISASMIVDEIQNAIRKIIK